MVVNNMVTEYDIIKQCITELFGDKIFKEQGIVEIIKKYSMDIIRFDFLTEEEEKSGEWMTLQYNDPSFPHGFIYYDCHMGRLKDLLDAIWYAENFKDMYKKIGEAYGKTNQ